MPKAVKNLRMFRPDSSDAKNVEDTKMLNTNARETVNQNEKNVVGEELIVTHKPFGKLGAVGRE